MDTQCFGICSEALWGYNSSSSPTIFFSIISLFNTREQTMSTITPHQLFIINDSLSNDENSTDEEMVECLIGNGVDGEVATKAVQFRDAFLTNPRAELVVGNDGELVLGI